MRPFGPPISRAWTDLTRIGFPRSQPSRVLRSLSRARVGTNFLAATRPGNGSSVSKRSVLGLAIFLRYFLDFSIVSKGLTGGASFLIFLGTAITRWLRSWL